MTRLSPLIFAALTIVGASPAIAQAPAAPAPRATGLARTLQVLKPEQVDPAHLIPPPPKDGSDLQKAELAEVQRVYRTRTPERHTQAEWDDKHEDINIFAGTLGPAVDFAKLPVTRKLLQTVEDEQSVVINMGKRHFLKNRPWANDSSIVACDYKPNAAPLTSYPSGHAGLGYSLGFVLAQLMPEKAEAILTRASEYAYSRVVCGAHYPSDIEASHVMATQVVMLMMQNAAFAAQFQAARAELKAAGLTAS